MLTALIDIRHIHLCYEASCDLLTNIVPIFRYAQALTHFQTIQLVQTLPPQGILKEA